MLLDVGHTIFLWYGNQSNKIEQQGTIVLAQNYLKSDPSGRDQDTPILVVKQGYEPPTFTGFFGVWDSSLWSDSKSFEELKKEMQGQQPVLNASDLLAPTANGLSFDSAKKYPLETLQEKDPEKLPGDVNPSNKELHLSAAEFEKVFKMDHDAYKALAGWKKTTLKKDAGIF
jgi:hypothetical protein